LAILLAPCQLDPGPTSAELPLFSVALQAERNCQAADELRSAAFATAPSYGDDAHGGQLNGGGALSTLAVRWDGLCRARDHDPLGLALISE
jgi:hypothetical protein